MRDPYVTMRAHRIHEHVAEALRLTRGNVARARKMLREEGMRPPRHVWLVAVSAYRDPEPGCLFDRV